MEEKEVGLTAILLGHPHTGKSAFLEAAAYVAGAKKTLGTLQKRDTISDFELEEQEKGFSIQLAVASLKWSNVTLSLIDTPGLYDFSGEVAAGLHAADIAILCINAAEGVKVGTQRSYRMVREKKLPLLLLFTGLDREEANEERVRESLRTKLGFQPLPLFEWQGGESPQLTSLLSGEVYTASGEKKERVELLLEQKEPLVEQIAETDDSLLEEYLEGKALDPGVLEEALYRGVEKGLLVPTFYAIPPQATFVPLLLDFLKDYATKTSRTFCASSSASDSAPATHPATLSAPFLGQVFKTFIDPYAGHVSLVRVWQGKLTAQTPLFNLTRGESERSTPPALPLGKELRRCEEVPAGAVAALSKLQITKTGDTLSAQKEEPLRLPPMPFPKGSFALSVEPERKEDEEKILEALHKLQEEDPTLAVERSAEFQETILTGLGETHLELALKRAQRKYHVATRTSFPSIPYRETIAVAAKAQGRYKKQSGGRGQFGDVFLAIEPLPRGEGFHFENKIVGGKIPKNYIPAVEKGIREAMEKGVLAGYPMMDIRATLYDGSYHPVDSSDLAFQIAGSLGFKKACEQARPLLLEPIVKLDILTPPEFVGDIFGDINAKRGKVVGTETESEVHKVTAYLPLAEVQHYAADIRALTAGQATFHIERDHYAPVPAPSAQKIIEKRRAKRS